MDLGFQHMYACLGYIDSSEYTPNTSCVFLRTENNQPNTDLLRQQQHETISRDLCKNCKRNKLIKMSIDQ